MAECSWLLTSRPYLSRPEGSNPSVFAIHAGIAQLEEQLICNQQAGGSSPSTSSIGRRSGQSTRHPAPPGKF